MKLLKITIAIILLIGMSTPYAMAERKKKKKKTKSAKATSLVLSKCYRVSVSNSSNDAESGAEFETRAECNNPKTEFLLSHSWILRRNSTQKVEDTSLAYSELIFSSDDSSIPVGISTYSLGTKGFRSDSYTVSLVGVCCRQ